MISPVVMNFWGELAPRSKGLKCSIKYTPFKFFPPAFTGRDGLRLMERGPIAAGTGPLSLCIWIWKIISCYRWMRPEPSPPASFSTSATVTML